MGFVDVNTGTGYAATGDGERVGVCEVHRLVDQDERPRRVHYCPVCDAWMCDECSRNWGRRARAMFLQRMGR
ncbi:MAG: hypothetical protein CXZ00_03025 [Acidobacteria bacterium]|nr:MAG: hypothetical protein CXZ00_03025 [Acidobacteriota bacterium]